MRTVNLRLDAELAEASQDEAEAKHMNEAAMAKRHFDVKSVLFEKTVKQFVKAKKADFIHNMVYLDGKKFDFTGREYLFPIYNGRFPRLLLKFSRQCEKCCTASKPLNTWNGSVKIAREVQVGDTLSGFDVASGKQIPVKVLGSETNGIKKLLKINIRSSQEIEVTENHPIFTFSGWRRADELKVGDRVACPRTIGGFGNMHEPFAAVIGMLYGDGHFAEQVNRKGGRSRQLGYTVANEECEAWFLKEAAAHLTPTTKHHKTGKRARMYNISLASELSKYFEDRKLFGQVSLTKKLPDDIYEWDRASTAELLRGLWATDGYCKTTNKGSRVELTYCTISPHLKEQVRTLLRKFGIITKVRTYQPKKGNLAYLITVVCRSSLENFHRYLGPIPGKPFDLPSAIENSHYDVIPKEVHKVIEDERIAAGGTYSNKGYVMDGKGPFFQSYEPSYDVNRHKILKAAEFLNSDKLKKIVADDIFWDEVESIEDIGEDETWAIQTENETYITDTILQHNSTFLANNLIIESAITPYNKAVYVAPSYLQTRQFSAGKLTPWMEDSPTISKYLLSSKVSSQVFEKGMTNGSMIFLRSAFLNADRVRGLSAQILALDEIQNFISSNIPVIMEVLSHAADPTALFAGTPLTNDNIIEQQWLESSQCEWLVKCHRHDPVHYNFLDERCIGKQGPICNKCGQPINPSLGEWVAFSKERDTMGFHLNQIMVPWMQTGPKWKEIVWKLDTYSKGQFYNEVLGISFDSASKPITRTELIANCSASHPMRLRPDEYTDNWQLVMGVDWGTGSDGSERDEKGRLRTASYTVVCIGAYTQPGKFHPFFFRKYKGDDAIPTNCIRDILSLANAFKVRMIGTDWGFGWAANDQLEASFGAHKVIKYQYVGMQRERMKYDPTSHKMVVSRTEVMSDFFTAIKKGNFIFPRWEESQEYLVDIEHIFAEVSSLGMLKYDHKKTEPDDCAHALIFAKETADKMLGLW